MASIPTRLAVVAIVALAGFVAAGVSTHAVAAEPGVERLDIEQPRSYGYQIGDKFERIVHVTLGDPNRLDPESLPKRGRISASLAIDEPRIEAHHEHGSMIYDITFTYQVINVHPEITDIPVPHHDIAYRNGDARFQILVPASRIGVTVIRGRTGGPDTQPDALPQLLPEDPTRLIALAGIFGLSVLALVVLHRGVPFFGSHGPFVRAERRLKAAGDQSWNGAGYGAALQLVHQGFDETAGRTVFPEHLDEFFAAHNAYGPMREPIEVFYLRSRAHFFGAAADAKRDRYTYAELADMVRKLRNIERRRA